MSLMSASLKLPNACCNQYQSEASPPPPSTHPPLPVQLEALAEHAGRCDRDDDTVLELSKCICLAMPPRV